MDKKNYANMYKPKTLKEINDELTAPVEEPEAPEAATEEAEEVKEEVKEEKIEEAKEEITEKIPEVKKEIVGTVTGGLSLNVRRTPGGEIIKAISNGVRVTIINDSNPDWYEISAPIKGFVMKKFIKLV